jgi:hypothetical protein
MLQRVSRRLGAQEKGIPVKSRGKIRFGETIGWWGCSSCRAPVPNNHTGPCAVCGGRIGRVVPSAVRLDVDLGVIRPLRDFVPKPAEPLRQDWTNVALVAAAVSCIAAPLLGASSAGWNAVMVIMALNIWSSSISYYALALVGRGEQRTEQGATAG